MYSGGDFRQLWARDTTEPPDAPLVRIELGEADALRSLCKEGRLTCPFPGCISPALNTAGGPLRRDHFRHVHRAVQVEHHPDTFFTYVGKQALAAWLRRQGAEVEVRLDPRLPHEARPDVLASFDGDRRFAFEVQYPPITIETWQRRHESYAQAGIHDFWLFGHLRSQLRRAHGEERQRGFYALSAFQRVLVESGMPLYWINPDDLVLGTRMVETGERTWRDDITLIGWDPFDACYLRGTALVSPTSERETARADELRRAGQRTRSDELAEERGREVRRRLDEQRRREEAVARAEEAARLAEVRGRQPVREVESPAPQSSRLPIREPPLPRIIPRRVPDFHDPTCRREVIEQALEPHVGKRMRTPEMIALLAEHGISLNDFVFEVSGLKRDGVISYGTLSLTGGWIDVPEKRP